MDYTGFGFPKPEPRIVDKKRATKDAHKAERECRIFVKSRDKGRCVVPGCKTPREGIEMHHVIPRSRSRRLKHATSNNCLLCRDHHGLRHAGKIQITGNANGELIIRGDRKWLEFKL